MQPASEERPCEHAREPDQEGYVERDGVKVWYEVFGERAARPFCCYRLVDRAVADLEGAGAVPGPARAGDHVRPHAGTGARTTLVAPAAYAAEEFVADALDVLDATGTDQAVLVSLSRGNRYALQPRRRPSRAGARLGGDRARTSSASVKRSTDPRTRPKGGSTTTFGVDEGWRPLQPAFVAARPSRGFAEFFFGMSCLPEPHSTKQVEDAVVLGDGHRAGDVSVADGAGDRPRLHRDAR